ncbi:MAG: PAS domain S-box protein [Melioribacteraceae bacterium]
MVKQNTSQVNDINDSKIAEEKSKILDNLYKIFFATAKEGILFLNEETGIIVEVNPFLIELLGYSYEDFIGKELWDIGAFKNIATSKDAFRELQNKDYIHFENIPLQTKDGKSINVEFSSNVYQVGKIKIILCNIRDITNQILTEEVLSQERNLLHSLIDNIPDRIYAKDLEGRFIICNNALINRMGVSDMKEIIGKTDFDLVPYELASRYRADELEIMQSGQPLINREEPMDSNTGETRWSLVTKIPLRNALGSIIGTVGVSKEITERKRIEEEIKKRNAELIKVNAEKDKFFSIIAHDLKNPFVGILGLTELMSDSSETFSPDEIIKNSKILNETARKFFKLLENLLKWAQVQNGSINYNPVDMDISETIIQSIDSINQRAVQKNITIIYANNNEQKILADEKMIETVLRNILSNAVKFTRKYGKVVVKSTRLENGSIEVSVSDDGVGMREEDVVRLFRIEEKVSTLGTDGELSTGLGLLLCKEFIDMHGGKIWVKSKVGEGSSFSFTLPKN